MLIWHCPKSYIVSSWWKAFLHVMFLSTWLPMPDTQLFFYYYFSHLFGGLPTTTHHHHHPQARQSLWPRRLSTMNPCVWLLTCGPLGSLHTSCKFLLLTLKVHYWYSCCLLSMLPTHYLYQKAQTCKACGNKSCLFSFSKWQDWVFPYQFQCKPYVYFYPNIRWRYDIYAINFYWFCFVILSFDSCFNDMKNIGHN